MKNKSKEKTTLMAPVNGIATPKGEEDLDLYRAGICLDGANYPSFNHQSGGRGKQPNILKKFIPD